MRRADVPLLRRAGCFVSGFLQHAHLLPRVEAAFSVVPAVAGQEGEVVVPGLVRACVGVLPERGVAEAQRPVGDDPRSVPEHGVEDR